MLNILFSTVAKNKLIKIIVWVFILLSGNSVSVSISTTCGVGRSGINSLDLDGYFRRYFNWTRAWEDYNIVNSFFSFLQPEICRIGLVINHKFSGRYFSGVVSFRIGIMEI